MSTNSSNAFGTWLAIWATISWSYYTLPRLSCLVTIGNMDLLCSMFTFYLRICNWRETHNWFSKYLRISSIIDSMCNDGNSENWSQFSENFWFNSITQRVDISKDISTVFKVGIYKRTCNDKKTVTCINIDVQGWQIHNNIAKEKSGHFWVRNALERANLTSYYMYLIRLANSLFAFRHFSCIFLDWIFSLSVNRTHPLSDADTERHTWNGTKPV
jgi:hypothetical protein